jgi:flagellar biosynthesis protein FliQ
MPLYLLLFSKALLALLACLYPIIGLLLLVTIATAIIQSALQLEDPALSLLPKTVVIILLVLFSGLGLLDSIRDLAVVWISHADRLVRQPWS